jgi:tRNA 2-thiocytidine biosynthesis protein TtcA
LPLVYPEASKTIDSGFTLIKQTIRRFGFLKKYSRVLVGVSGGMDSLVLLSLLLAYNKKFNQKWHINACHIHPRFPKWNSRFLELFFKEKNIPYTIVKININKKFPKNKHPCYACTRERRKKLLEVADKHSIFQIALGHHKEDVAETTFLNMMYNGEISTIVPKQSIIQGRFFFIRPLYYLTKETIRKIAKIYHLPKSKSTCPYYKESKREVVREFLNQIKNENPAVYKNIFRSLFNIKNSYMPH